ncbi:MAG TPA: sugar ABC transporter ATP-binding protein [Stellaceae bacterium]|nr:sugar ABC transporter ATP-binding protein [Stellaceae bacterium]
MSVPALKETPAPLPSAAPLVEFRGLRRNFGETIALADCSFEIQPGEIHALVGENGSGKSTLIKILSGILPESGGELLWDGKVTRIADPRTAQQHGIATVFQETLVLDQLSVRDNVVLGLDRLFRRVHSVADETKLVREALDTIGMNALDPAMPVAALSLAQRQGVTIARALLRPWRLLVLDESTSALDVDARDRLFEALRGFRAAGRSILFVSHRMDEILDVADRSTVLRSGRSVATLTRAETTTDGLLELMSTHEEAQAAEGAARAVPNRALGAPVIAAKGVALLPETAPFDLTVRAGEIVGIAGLEGHGQVAFVEAVAGLRRPAHGAVETDQGAITSFSNAARAGIAYLPRERKTQGIFAPLSVLDNLTISALKRFAHFGILAESRRRAEGRRLIAQSHVATAGLGAPISALSGGNQQKVFLGRLLALNPRALVLNDPMRGVDLGAKQDIYKILEQFASDGGAVMLLSTELAELCLLCDRVAVFHNRALFAVIERKSLDVQALIAAMFGQSGASRGTA